MVSMGFLEPSTGRADRGEATGLGNSENCWKRASPHPSDIPPTSSQFKKACGKHARAPFFLPRPPPASEEEHPDHNSRLVAIASTATTKRERMAMAIERGRDYERGCGRGG
ncbi:hypothetical protein HU200_057989 [Digitaria exilis]|uniref:Uncharacterized protein n=1 Tax=Digitaria exilis TaxID=1010633 RepID=A0A835AEI4_9POAL|nr:hypothetical protein HU200_057989 [Digitaria exilis]